MYVLFKYVCTYVSSIPYHCLDIDDSSSLDEQGNHLGVAIGGSYYKGSPPILSETFIPYYQTSR